MNTNPLLYTLELGGPWVTPFVGMNFLLALLCTLFVLQSMWCRPQRLARPGFIIALLAMVFYQWPLVLLSPLLDAHLPNAVWFSGSVHAAVAVNLLWVMLTPRLTAAAAAEIRVNASQFDFKGVTLWLPVALFFTLAIAYFAHIPFTCTALYAFFVDPDLSHVIREITGKLVASKYAPHVLNILTSAVGPIVAFLSAGKIYAALAHKRWHVLPLWTALLLAVIAMPLASGAKGTLIPLAVTLAVACFLIMQKWVWRIVSVAAIMGVLSLMIVVIKVVTESNVGKGTYAFGRCVVELGACERTMPLLNSLRAPDFSLGLTKSRIDELEGEMHNACGDGKTTPMSAEALPSLEHPPKTPVVDKGKMSVFERMEWVLYRAFVTPLQVANWHYLYVHEHGMPGMLGLPIAKKLSDNYVNVPAEVCQAYYLGGDKTATCTAPTSYLFIYPAYLGVLGLLLACMATISFDIAGALVIRAVARPLSSLAVGLMAAAGVNFMVSDYATVLVSHGAGVAIALLAIFGVASVQGQGRRGG